MFKNIFGKQTVEVPLIEPEYDRSGMAYWLGDASGYVVSGGPKSEMDKRQEQINKILGEYEYYKKQLKVEHKSGERE